LKKPHYTRAYLINIMVVLIIFPVIDQTVINVIMLSIGGQGTNKGKQWDSYVNDNPRAQTV